MKSIPNTCTPYKQTPLFDENSIPAGLTKAHQTKAGTWGRIVILEGKLRYRILAPEVAEYLLNPEEFGVVAPQELHEVAPAGTVKFYVEFWRDETHIRKARPDDLASLAAIELAAGKLFPAERIPDPEATLPEAQLARSLNAGILFVAEVAGAVVGFAVSTVEGSYLHLDEVSVHPDFGKRGIGESLVKRVIRACVDQELAGVSLTTFADLRWNAPFYRKLGFVEPVRDNLPTHVAQHLEGEREAGLTQRVGMVYVNAT